MSIFQGHSDNIDVASILPCTCRVWNANVQVIKEARQVLEKFLEHHGYHMAWVGLSAHNFYQCNGKIIGAWMIDLMTTPCNPQVDISSLTTLLQASVEEIESNCIRLKVLCDHEHSVLN